MPPAHLTIRSPYDHQAHYGHKRDLSWYGDKVHFSETCDETVPHLITHVVTTNATEPDIEQTEAIHQALAEHTLLPNTHVMDAGYVDAGLILKSQEQYEVALVGPVSQNHQCINARFVLTVNASISWSLPQDGEGSSYMIRRSRRGLAKRDANLVMLAHITLALTSGRPKQHMATTWHRFRSIGTRTTPSVPKESRA